MSNGMRWTEEQIRAYEQRSGATVAKKTVVTATVFKDGKSASHGGVVPGAANVAKRKYRNTRVTVDGKKFDSKLEGRYYKLLQMQWQSTQNKIASGMALREGDLLWVVRQVSIELQGGVRYRLDFQVVRKGCSLCCHHIELIDCKGVLTQVSANKIKQAESLLGAKIILANESDVKGITISPRAADIAPPQSVWP